MVNTRAGSRYGHADYVSAGCGMGYEATMYLLERGVRLTGTDAWSWDAPFVHTAKKYGETQDASLIWEGHKAGRDIGYCHIEKLHNLEALPADGFFISCFPHKIRGASAGWTRAVAIFDDALMAERLKLRMDARPHPRRRRRAAGWPRPTAEGCDFPIQNLPFAVFRRAGSGEGFRGGVAIGDQVRRPRRAGGGAARSKAWRSTPRAPAPSRCSTTSSRSARRPGARCATRCSPR